MFDQATLQILEDMERTLAGDAPILVGNWTAKIRFSPDDTEYVSCGCLMMDNHVEEFYTSGYSSELHFLEELYGVESSIIGDLADEFDTWSKSQSYDLRRKYRLVFTRNHDRKVLKDEYRAELLEVVRAEIKARA